MSFTEYKFFIFFAIVYGSMWISKLVLSNKSIFVSTNKIILLSASYLLVAIVDWRFCLSLCVVTILVYFIALRLDRNPKFK